MTFNEWIDEQSELVNKFGTNGFIDMLPALQEAYLAGAGSMSKDNDQKQTVTCKNGLQVREWVGLTEDELYQLWCATPPEYEDRYGLARAVEAKLKEKNT
jgi:hypothetical protein